MKKLTRMVPLALAFGIGLSFGAASVARAESSPCPANMVSYSNLKDGQSVKCTCPAMEGARSVWGSSRYTVDSDVCRAAVHAGAAKSSGGEVTVWLSEGCPIFRGNAKSGVQSREYGPYRRTYHFVKDAPPCQVQTKDDPVRDCPYSMSTFGYMKPGQTWRCKCTAQRVKSSGTVWGNQRYTVDSNLCLAAKHAGMVKDEGGEITAYTDAGCPRYEASSANGITTREWRAHPMSYAFKKPLPACAK